MSEFDCIEYDSMILNPSVRELYSNSAYYNMGFWKDETNSIKNACENLVREHIRWVGKDFVADRILDVGCGLGASTVLLAQCYERAKVYGINISSKQMDFLKQIPENVLFKQMDASKLNFPKNTFELIVSVEAVFHFNSRMDFIRRAYNILVSGGTLIFSDILTSDEDCMRYCSIPETNSINKISLYNRSIEKVGFKIAHQQNITKYTWLKFAHFLKKTNLPHLISMSEKLSCWPATYILTKLVKP